MLTHIGELYLLDSRRLIATIEQSLESGNGPELARAAHAWRSYNGNVGAYVWRSCAANSRTRHVRQISATRARRYAQIQALHHRVRDELQLEMRKSA